MNDDLLRDFIRDLRGERLDGHGITGTLGGVGVTVDKSGTIQISLADSKAGGKQTKNNNEKGK